MSAGFAPLRMRPGIVSELAAAFGSVRAVAHQSAGCDELSPLVNGRDRVLRHERDDLITNDLKKRGRAENDPSDIALRHGRKGLIDLRFRARGYHQQRLANGPRTCLQHFHLCRGRWVVRVDDECDQAWLRHELAQETQAFWTQFTRESADAGGVSTGAIETRDESGLDRVPANAKGDGDRRGRRL